MDKQRQIETVTKTNRDSNKERKRDRWIEGNKQRRSKEM